MPLEMSNGGARECRLFRSRPLAIRSEPGPIHASRAGGNWFICAKWGQPWKSAAKLRANGPFLMVVSHSTTRIRPTIASFENCSDEGAKITVGETLPLPHEFDFLIPGRRESRRARLVWRRGASGPDVRGVRHKRDFCRSAVPRNRSSAYDNSILIASSARPWADRALTTKREKESWPSGHVAPCGRQLFLKPPRGILIPLSSHLTARDAEPLGRRTSPP